MPAFIVTLDIERFRRASKAKFMQRQLPKMEIQVVSNPNLPDSVHVDLSSSSMTLESTRGSNAKFFSSSGCADSPRNSVYYLKSQDGAEYV